MMALTKKKIIIFLIGCFLLIVSQVNAQTEPEFLVSWRVLNYVPADYQGKIFPSQNSQIEIGFDLLENGKIIDLSKNIISWFVDGNSAQSANGLKTIRFNTGGADQTIRITILNYKGADLDKVIIVPVNKPEVVIDARIPQSEIKLGQYNLEARPFFFNVLNASNLLFKWTNNNQPIAGNPKTINLDLKSSGVPTETKINISLSVVNSFNQLEFVNQQINLTVK